MTDITAITTPAGRANGLTKQDYRDNEEVDMEPLTDEQVKNWRNMLCQMFGPFAFIMSREAIEEYRARMQERAILLDAELTEPLDATPER